MPHFPILRTLLELYSKLLKTLARSIHVIHSDGDMTKASRLAITVMVGRLSQVLRAMIMRELQDA